MEICGKKTKDDKMKAKTRLLENARPWLKEI
jgi:hypothetical protein